MNKQLHLMIGISASGKSTLADRIAGTYYQPDTLVILCPDTFRLKLTGQAFYSPAEDMVWSHVKTAARVLLVQCHVLIDATSYTEASRQQWIRLAQQEGCEVHGHWLQAD